MQLLTVFIGQQTTIAAIYNRQHIKIS